MGRTFCVAETSIRVTQNNRNSFFVISSEEDGKSEQRSLKIRFAFGMARRREMFSFFMCCSWGIADHLTTSSVGKATTRTQTTDRRGTNFSFRAQQEERSTNAESMFVLAFNIRARILASTENHDGMPQIPRWLKWWRNVMQGKGRTRPATSLYTLHGSRCWCLMHNSTFRSFALLFLRNFVFRLEERNNLFGVRRARRNSEILFESVFRLLSLPRAILKRDFLGISISFLLTLNPQIAALYFSPLPFSLSLANALHKINY